jgi:signal transduction histidine kinase/CheY-like chemotaxis protein
VDLQLSRVSAIAAAFSHERDDADRTEWGQAVVRLVIGSAAGVYVVTRLLTADPTETMTFQQRVAIGLYVPIFFVAATGVLISIRRHPGHFFWRRLLAMVIDYVSLALTMILGGAVMAPLAAIIISATVGYGMRYGPGYLAVATTIATASVVAIVSWTPYWRENTDAVAMLVVLLLSAPLYTMTLLRQSEAAWQSEVKAALAKSRFLAQASHDLRQPVHAIGLFIAALRNTGLTNAQLGIVERIDRSLRGVSHLFKSLLDISTLDSGAVRPDPEVIGLQTFLDDIRQRHAEAALWGGVDLRVVGSRLSVLADRALVTAMLDGLIDNALKHAHSKRLLIGCRRRGGLVSLVVCDQGVGIDPVHLPRLSELFYKVDTSGGKDLQGVGLGLSIVDRMAGLCGWKLRIVSRPGHGVLAALDGLVPAVADRSNLQAGSEGQASLPMIDDRVAGTRVLLIEDDLDLLAATRELLISWQCEVQAFASMPDSVKPWDIIITDLDIGGGVSGLDCIRALRARAAEPGRSTTLPALVLTGHDIGRSGEPLPENTITLSKPISIQAVYRAMVTLLSSENVRL